MISSSVFTAFSIVLIIGIIVPFIAFMLYSLRNKRHHCASAWLWGAFIFVIVHFFCRVPVLSFFTMIDVSFSETNYVLYSILFILIVSCFEVLARYVIYYMLNGNQLTYKRCIAAGMGYEGIENFITLGIPYGINMIILQIISAGLFDEVLQSMKVEEGVRSLIEIRDVLVNMTELDLYLTAYGSVITMIIHTALTLYVCHVMWKSHNKKVLWHVMGIYTGIDLIVWLLEGLSTPHMGSIVSLQASVVMKYSFLTIVGIIAILYIILIHHCWKQEEGEKEAEN